VAIEKQNAVGRPILLAKQFRRKGGHSRIVDQGHPSRCTTSSRDPNSQAWYSLART